MKKILFLILTIAILTIVVGCGYSEEEKKYMKQLEKQASQNSINYIEKKYGFTPTIISTKIEKVNSDPIPNFFPEPTGYIFVSLMYNNKTFQVYINGKEESYDGYDNYQYDEITHDLITLLNEKTNLKPYKYEIYYGRFVNSQYNVRISYNGFIKNLYLKNNIDIISNEMGSAKVKIDYINQSNLEYIKNNAVFDDLSINFDNLELYNYYSIESYNSSNHQKEDALNIESSCIYNSFAQEKYEYTKYNLKTIGDVYYHNKYYLDEEINLVETTIIDASIWIGYGASENVRQISKVYKIDGITNFPGSASKTSEVLYFYIPVDSIENYNIKDIKVGISCVGSLQTSSNVVKINNYIFGEVIINSCINNKDNIMFTLLYSPHK